jgi:uncharacterized protein YfaP (DUF2135 family)
MKRFMGSVIALAAAVLLLSSCTIRLHGTASATTSAKASAKAETKPVVVAKPIDEPQPVAAGTVAKAEAKVVVGIKVPKVAQGAKAKEVACPNTTEVTNGIDDDCDGQIDENEVGSGPLQITLWWEGPADIDLKVQPPKGKQINYKEKKAAGGYMDKDSRSSCKGGQTIENVYWTDSPPKGIYTVLVNYYSSCKDKTAAPATANVTVSYKGQLLGPYSLEMNKGDEVEILQFNLEE